MTGDVAVYGLIDPRNGELRYVGKAVDPQKRLWIHLSIARTNRYGSLHVKHWIQSLLAVGLRPEIEVLEPHALPAATTVSVAMTAVWARKKALA